MLYCIHIHTVSHLVVNHEKSHDNCIVEVALDMIWISIFIGCTAIDAPEDFDALNSFLYENFHASNRHLEEGLENLITWLPENEGDLAEGYRVSKLSDAAIATVDQIAPKSLIGIALSREYDHSVDDVAYASFAVHPEDLNPEAENYNIREYVTDAECFLNHECDVIQYTGEVQSFLPLGIEIITYIFSEARWVETSLGTAYVQRRWHTNPPDISVDWVNVEAEYGFIITLPQPMGDVTNVKRIESMWANMSIDGLPVPEDIAVEMALGSLRDSIDITDNYLDENTVP